MQPGQFFRFRVPPRLSRGAGERAFFLLAAPVLDMGVVQPFPAQQLAALRAALRQRVERRQDPCLVRRGERRRFGRAGCPPVT